MEGKGQPVGVRLFFADIKNLLFCVADELEDFMPGLVRINADIQVRGRIGRDHFDYIAAVHLQQRFFQAQQRQRAMQAAGVDFDIKFNHRTILTCNDSVKALYNTTLPTLRE